MRTGRLFALALLTVSGAAEAQPAPSLDLRGFEPPPSHRGSLYLEPTAVPGPGEWNVAAMASYAKNGVVLVDESGNEVGVPLRHQASLDYLASVGILDRLALRLSLPTAIYQSGDDGDATTGEPLPQTAIGDAAIGAKATLVPTKELGGFGLAAIGTFTAPTGDERSYLGEGEATGQLRLLSELRLVAVALQATAGVKVRGQEQEYVGEELGHGLPWGVGLSVKPQALGWDDSGRWTWVAEARGTVAITPELGSGAQSPALAGLSARYTVGDVSAIAGVELPLSSAIGVPNYRGVLGIGWAPRYYDKDGDGVEDELDDCPELREDPDGFADGDGCPDFDNDDDGVPDETDRCASEREDEDGFEDDDGCPDPDNDGDGVLDANDRCPNEAGELGSGAGAGCPVNDNDSDGVLNDADRCADEAEDIDGFQDGDGCPELDNDRDGVPDAEDECRNVAGAWRSDPKLNGCPSPDTDGDTIVGKADRCPTEAEDFDGVDDDDGCPDDDSDQPAWKRAKPLVTIDASGKAPVVKWRVPPKLVGKGDDAQIDPKTLSSVRALAAELNQKPSWIVAIGVRPAGRGSGPEQEALNRSFLLVQTLRELTYRDGVAESVSWDAVKGQPGAFRAGFGVLVLPGAEDAAEPKPKKMRVTPVPLAPKKP